MKYKILAGLIVFALIAAIPMLHQSMASGTSGSAVKAQSVQNGTVTVMAINHATFITAMQLP